MVPRHGCWASAHHIHRWRLSGSRQGRHSQMNEGCSDQTLLPSQCDTISTDQLRKRYQAACVSWFIASLLAFNRGMTDPSQGRAPTRRGLVATWWPGQLRPLQAGAWPAGGTDTTMAKPLMGLPPGMSNKEDGASKGNATPAQAKC